MKHCAQCKKKIKDEEAVQIPLDKYPGLDIPREIEDEGSYIWKVTHVVLCEKCWEVAQK